MSVGLVVLLLLGAVAYRATRAESGGYTTVMPVAGIFGSRSVWRQDVSRAAVADDSADLVSTLVGQITPNYDGNAIVSSAGYNVSFVSVQSGVARHDVVFDDCTGKGSTPSQIHDSAFGEPFTSVPIPSDVSAANGTDGELSVFDAASDQLWEFWQAHREDDRWHACWGGRIDDVSQSDAVFTWPMGVAASGLALTDGVVRIREAQRGVIDHALYLTVLQAATYPDFSYPATRTDGGVAVGTDGAIQEGRRFRLDPSVDVTALGLTPLATAIAKAAQKYGFIVGDVGGAVQVDTESGVGYARAHQGSDPWTAILEGVRQEQVLAGFPWDKLQALPKNWGKP